MSKEIVKQETLEMMEWTLDNGSPLKFTLEDAKNIAGNSEVTAKEFGLFCNICKADKLNPFTKDAYLIKFGDKPAQIITGKNSAVKIANRNKNYDGHQAGIIVLDKSNKAIHREGSMVYDSEKLVGGWAKVFRKDRSIPTYIEVSLKEYAKQAQWKVMPATMIRKVPLVQALRESFPEELNNVYDESEVGAMQNNNQAENKNTKQKVADIFNKKDEEIIEGEVVEAEEDKPDVLLNELKIYVKALKLSDEKINQLFEKHDVSSWEELTDDIKQKCIDRLKPQYEALKEESK